MSLLNILLLISRALRFSSSFLECTINKSIPQAKVKKILIDFLCGSLCGSCVAGRGAYFFLAHRFCAAILAIFERFEGARARSEIGRKIGLSFFGLDLGGFHAHNSPHELVEVHEKIVFFLRILFLFFCGFRGTLFNLIIPDL